jgi:hypothetical protein
MSTRATCCGRGLALASICVSLAPGCGNEATPNQEPPAEAGGDSAGSPPNESGSRDAANASSGDATSDSGPGSALDSGSTSTRESGGGVDSDAGQNRSGDAPSDSGGDVAPDSTSHGSDGATADAGVTLVNPAPASKFFVGANFWNIDWEGQNDTFQSGVDFATTTNPWQPQFLADLAPYHVLRFMDWNQTNMSANPQANWTTRKQKTQLQNEPVAFEWQIDLCNRTKKDFWLNVPHESTADYWTKLAQLVHDQLDPSLRVYVEWSNEVWNASFPARAYAAGQAASLGLPGSDPTAAYYVYVSVRMYEAFQNVFGAGNPRLVRVLAGQAGWTGPCGWHMTALKNSSINPKATMPDVYAIAPYFTGTSINALRGDIATASGGTMSHVTCVAANRLPIISYEGGSDSFSAGNGCASLQIDPGMHDLYTSYLDAQSAAGMKGPLMQYTHAGSCWGLIQKTGDPRSASPKYQGVLDWLAAHP